ncbi:Rv3654c family TadE-like protein [Leifsonia sp. NPDC058194]|uniref:Rv3654c family TadE-like protein n=1 Tax=Leifsonia sp. NPDC058194 TaxID=3346374 RepID=UPI0036DAE9F4
MRPGDGGRERGAGSVVVLAIVGAMIAVLVAILAVGGVHIAHRRAAAVADLAALGAADAAVGRIGDEPCAAASRVAEANGADLDDCAADGVRMTVTVGVGIPGGMRVTGRARAGPPRRRRSP